MKPLFCIALCICASLILFTPGHAFAAQNVVIEDGARMREQPSADARAICKLDSKCNVTLIEQAGKWYKISYKGQEGYVHGSLVTIKGDEPVPQAGSASTGTEQTASAQTSSISASGMLQRGDEGSEVEALQAALKQWGYFSEEVTGLFGRLTQQAVKAFQQANGLHVDGVAGKATLNKLQNGAAPPPAEQAVTQPVKLPADTASGNVQQALYTPSAVTVSEVRFGDVGKNVKSLQQALANLGLFSERIDGAYGDKTQQAVKTFQEMNGIKPDGMAGQATLSLLGLLSAQPVQTASSSGQSSGSVENTSNNSASIPATAYADGGLPSNIELIDWFSGGKEAFVKKARARVLDIKTGMVYYVSAFSAGNHADVEPITAEDTAIIKATYNGQWDWDPRPVVVTVNGRSFVGAINGMPHGGQTNYDNNMDGQLCIHLLNSKTHNGNREYEKDLQDAVMEAWRSVGGR